MKPNFQAGRLRFQGALIKATPEHVKVVLCGDTYPDMTDGQVKLNGVIINPNQDDPELAALSRAMVAFPPEKKPQTAESNPQALLGNKASEKPSMGEKRQILAQTVLRLIGQGRLNLEESLRNRLLAVIKEGKFSSFSAATGAWAADHFCESQKYIARGSSSQPATSKPSSPKAPPGFIRRIARLLSFKRTDAHQTL